MKLGSLAAKRERTALKLIDEYVPEDMTNAETSGSEDYDNACPDYILIGQTEKLEEFQPYWNYHIRDIARDLEKYGLIEILLPPYGVEPWRFPRYKLTQEGMDFLGGNTKTE